MVYFQHVYLLHTYTVSQFISRLRHRILLKCYKIEFLKPSVSIYKSIQLIARVQKVDNLVVHKFNNVRKALTMATKQYTQSSISVIISLTFAYNSISIFVRALTYGSAASNFLCP